MAFELERDELKVAQIRVIGVGGAGGNAVTRMADGGQVMGCELIAVNTDAQDLNKCHASRTVLIGQKLTKGLGAGCNPKIGEQAAEESRDALEEILRGTDMVFITAGMGGGTGTGAAPVIAEIAKKNGVLTVGVVTKPFGFEGQRKMALAMEGIAKLQEHVDSLIIIPNEKLRPMMKQGFTVEKAFAMADTVLGQGVLSITQLIQDPGYMNTDFADVTTVMKGAGLAHMAVGFGKGEGKARTAVQDAIDSPLLETSIDGATGVIVHFNAGNDFDLSELYDAMDAINEKAKPDALIIPGYRTTDGMDDAVSVTVIATGFSVQKAAGAAPNPGKPNGEPASAAAPPTGTRVSGGGLLWDGSVGRASALVRPSATPTSTPEVPSAAPNSFTRENDTLNEDYFQMLHDMREPPPVG
ncbi:MAG: cell division protein FtsZ [Oscillospiraceae bacterium]|jgi:cell division protein FtsZ|nr:cell division protein FtsZ [Oscillospiraceae bacterium]